MTYPWNAGEVLTAADLNSEFASKADLASPTFTGTPAAPTAAAGTNTTQIATTAFVLANGGLVKITDATFTSVSSVSVNNCFTSTYANYRIQVTATCSANGALQWRFRASGSDNTSSQYQRANLRFGSNGTTYDDGANSLTLTQVAFTSTNVAVTGYVDVLRPFTADSYKSHAGICNGYNADISNSFLGVYTGTCNNTTAYDGFSIIPSSGTITGTIRVYGYKD